MSYGLRSVWALGLFFIFLFLFFCEFEIFSTDLQTVEYYFLVSLICLEICFLVCILSFKNVAYFFFLCLVTPFIVYIALEPKNLA